MPKLDFSRSTCFVYVSREGAFSPVGHDLKLRVTNFTIKGSEEPLSIQADFRADSLRILGGIKDGRVNESAPTVQEKQMIEGNIVDDVLEARKYGAVSFRSTSIEKVNDRQYRVAGQLDLHGVRKDLRFMVDLKASYAKAVVLLYQNDFRIKPFSSFMGALRVKPAVLIEISVPVLAL
jgi:hypothetical protein